MTEIKKIVKNIKIDNISNEFIGYTFLNDKKCFVENSVINDLVNIEVYKETSKFYLAKIIDFIQSSSFRVNPQCKFFPSCGGCNLQHINEDFYYSIKKNSLKQILEFSNYKFDEINILKIKQSERRRLSLQYKNKKYGFFNHNSKELIEIDFCINATKEINEIIKILKTVHLSNLNNINILQADNGIGLNLVFQKIPNINELSKLQILKSKVVSIFYNTVDEKYSIPVFKNDELYLNLDKLKIILPINCFLQPTKNSQDLIINIIVNELQNYKKIADLYCGVGTYSFPLAKNHTVSCFEGNDIMVNNLKQNNKLNKLNLNIVNKDLFNQPLMIRELNEFDAIIMNPPRNGAENQCKFLSKSNVKKIIYISCDPQTLSRDLKLFDKNNFILKKTFLLDQFYWSNHMESIVILENNNIINNII